MREKVGRSRAVMRQSTAVKSTNKGNSARAKVKLCQSLGLGLQVGGTRSLTIFLHASRVSSTAHLDPTWKSLRQPTG